MRNRAKCKKCSSVIESMLPDEIVYCKCASIAVCDGSAMRQWPFGSPDFLRIDDLGNERVVSYKDKGPEGESDKECDKPDEPRSKSDLIRDIESALEYTENAPDHEKYSFATNIALCHFMRAVVNILKRD